MEQDQPSGKDGSGRSEVMDEEVSLRRSPGIHSLASWVPAKLCSNISKVEQDGRDAENHGTPTRAS